MHAAKLLLIITVARVRAIASVHCVVAAICARGAQS